jgi:hypothetical protein
VVAAQDALQLELSEARQATPGAGEYAGVARHAAVQEREISAATNEVCDGCDRPCSVASAGTACQARCGWRGGSRTW